MSQFSIRKLERSDVDQLRELLATRDDTEAEELDRRLDMMKWLAFDNPVADGEPTYFVAEAEGKLIAHLGRMPNNFLIDGKVVRGYYIHDLFVCPAYRQKGMGLFISLALYKATKEESDSFCALPFATPLNLRIQRRLPFYQEVAVDNYVKILKTEVILHGLVKSGRVLQLLSWVPNVLLSTIDTVMQNMSSVEVERVERFDERFDALNDSLSSRLGICSAKTADFLNWKYIDRPVTSHRVYAVFEEGKVLGFVSLGFARYLDHGQPVGLIMDLTADPADKKTISALAAKAVSHFRTLGAGTIQCILTQPGIASGLKRHLFLHRNAWKQPMMLGNLDKSPVPGMDLSDMRLWHMTKGESDGSMFL